jgi:hypothetical protein
MSNAKKAAKASPSIVEDEDALVDKIAQDIQPSGNDIASTDLGLTPVADRSPSQPDAEGFVLMVDAEGNQADVDAAQVKIHERSGWKRVKEEEV